MKVRISRRKKKYFLGCVRFPQCKGSRSLKAKRGKGYRRKFEKFHGRKIKSGCDIHHVDGDSTNDDPGNWMEIDKEAHRELHKMINRHNATVELGTKYFVEVQIMEKRLKKDA